MTEKPVDQENPYLRAIERNTIDNRDKETSQPPLAPMPTSTPHVGSYLGHTERENFEELLPQEYWDKASSTNTAPSDISHNTQGPQDQLTWPEDTTVQPQAKQPQHIPTAEPKDKQPRGKRKSLKAKAMTQAASFAVGKRPGPIVPKGTIAGHSLMLVIAIMSFLAALTVAAVTIISDATRDWQSDISRGATIQIRQVDGIDIETELAKAITIARQSPGISSATVLSASESGALLEPWLGLDLSFDDLPIPRLIELTIDNPSAVDFVTLSKSLQQQVTGAILDNHRFWVERLRSMAETAILVGFTILLLVIAATVLTVVFATRSAMSGNKETIEVLHFVGASNKFIAGEFQRKFFTLGFKGALAGGGAAIFIFLIMQLLVREDEGSATLDQMQALLGVVDLGLAAYIGTFALVVVIAVFTAITTRLTVMNTLSKLS
ncbi:cell division protein FtsX [Cohaesibacter celericrescens]|uniref:ABC transporter permease n=1 Tax=Cohaesibacter celericrescens TaxID=2067669 RepID=A0A2N5XUD4_9HYPH|nr:ABC transporter permease [Cohaesibacter celericrescens]PLW78055.1 ABC transporter permease [Cohaesibacter celericrescens]